MNKEELEKKHGKTWNTKQLTRDFIVEYFLAPYTQVIRKTDNKKGLLTFQHDPRYYFDFQPFK